MFDLSHLRRTYYKVDKMTSVTIITFSGEHNWTKQPLCPY